MKQRLFVLTILVIGISVIAKAQKEEFKERIGVKGGQGVFWEKKDGVLIISGHGRMPDFNNEHCHWWREINKVVIQYGVTSIGMNAFHGCTALTNIEIPSSVSSIGGFAFAGCTSLKSIKISTSVEKLGVAVFQDCSSMTSVVIPSTVTFDDSNTAGYNYGNFGNIIKGSFAGYDGTVRLAIVGPNNSVFFLIRERGLWGLNNGEGEEIVSPELSLLEPAGKGFLRFKIDSYYGIMNYTGKIIIPNSRCYTYIGDYKSLTKRFTYSMNGFEGECNQLGQQISKRRVAKPKPSTTVSSSSTSSNTSSSNSSSSNSASTSNSGSSNSSSSSSNSNGNSSTGSSTTTVVVEQHGPVQVWVPCGACGHNPGVCQTCVGMGTSASGRICISCHGTGKCHFCNGQGGRYQVEYR